MQNNLETDFHEGWGRFFCCEWCKDQNKKRRDIRIFKDQRNCLTVTETFTDVTRRLWSYAALFPGQYREWPYIVLYCFLLSVYLKKLQLFMLQPLLLPLPKNFCATCGKLFFNFLPYFLKNMSCKKIFRKKLVMLVNGHSLLDPAWQCARNWHACMFSICAMHNHFNFP